MSKVVPSKNDFEDYSLKDVLFQLKQRQESDTTNPRKLEKEPAHKKSNSQQIRLKQLQLPLGMQSFGKNELAYELMKSDNSKQSDLCIKKIRKIKALSPAHIFRQLPSRPEAQNSSQSNSQRRLHKISQLPFLLKSPRSAQIPRLTRSQLDCARQDSDPIIIIIIIDQSDRTCFTPKNVYDSGLSSERNRIQSARVIPSKKEFGSPNSSNINTSRLTTEDGTPRVLSSFNKENVKKEKEKVVVFRKISRTDLTSLINSPPQTKLQDNCGQSKGFSIRTNSEYFSGIPAPFIKKTRTPAAIPKLTLSDVVLQRSQQRDGANSFMINRSSDVKENINTTTVAATTAREIRDNCFPSAREQSARSNASHRKKSQKFRNEESILNKIFNLKSTTFSDEFA